MRSYEDKTLEKSYCRCWRLLVLPVYYTDRINHIKKDSCNFVNRRIPYISGARDRNRTGTGFEVPQDFKSCASASSATRAIFIWRRRPDLNRGIKDLQSSALATWLRRHIKWSGKRDSNSRPSPWQGDALPLSYSRISKGKAKSLPGILNGASGRNRTADTRIFSPLLYQLSYRGKTMAEPTGIEPAIFGVTGRHVNRYTTAPHGGR